MLDRSTIDAYCLSATSHRSPLLDEIHQTKPFASLRQEAALGLLHSADLVRRKVAEVVEPFGVTPQQYNVLRILRGAGSDGLPTLTIGERMLEQTPGVTRLVDRLVSKGWVNRRRSPEDRRQVVCRITVPGLELLARLDEPVRSVDSAVIGNLDDHEVRVLVALLDRLRAGLRSGSSSGRPAAVT